MSSAYDATVSAGSMRGDEPYAVVWAHRWTGGGVVVEATFTGAHLLHLAVAGCVLNDLYREAEILGLALDGVRVRAEGGFDTEAWTSTGVTYVVDLDTRASAEERRILLARVDEVAEIPRALREGAAVVRVER